MSERRFSLKPFETEDAPPDLTIEGAVGRNDNFFSISYTLQGSLSKLMIPEPEEASARRDGLWEETCLEFFLATEGDERYWEFNLSPSGHWNVYRFTSYRKGMTEEPAFTSLPFGVRRESNKLTLTLELTLDEIIPGDKPVEVAVSAVIKTKDGRISYWALTHPDPQPDFHRRGSFVIGL